MVDRDIDRSDFRRVKVDKSETNIEVSQLRPRIPD